MDFEFEQLEPAPVRPEELLDKEIFQPKWSCFCCRDSGKVNPDLARRVISGYDYARDRLPICSACTKGQNWAHLNELGVIDQRLNYQICKKLDAFAREDWRRTTEAWFQMAKQRAEQGVTEISQACNLRRRDRIQAEFILSQEKHGKERGDWEEIPEDDDEMLGDFYE